MSKSNCSIWNILGLPFLLIALLLPSSHLLAQSPVLEKGEELKHLDAFVGKWQGEIKRKMPGGRQLHISPRLTVTWELGGVWLQAQDVSELASGTKIYGRLVMTWSKRDGTYRGTWKDNVMSETVPFTGRWVDENVLQLDSGETTFRGRKHRIVYTYRFEDENQFQTHLQMAWDGDELATVSKGEFRRIEAPDSDK